MFYERHTKTNRMHTLCHFFNLTIKTKNDDSLHPLSSFKKRYKKTRHLALWICIYLKEESLLLLYFAGLKSWLPFYITRWVFSSIWCYISLAPKSNFLLYFLSYMPCSDTSYCLSASKNIPFSKSEVNTFLKKFFQL